MCWHWTGDDSGNGSTHTAIQPGSFNCNRETLDCQSTVSNINSTVGDPSSTRKCLIGHPEDQISRPLKVLEFTAARRNNSSLCSRFTYAGGRSTAESDSPRAGVACSFLARRHAALAIPSCALSTLHTRMDGGEPNCPDPTHQRQTSWPI
ncbi:uncharacterized protein BCR38DRAFT_89190 [Pseudomassariella vexata]|uniref:Uncharacterized protein n=1 Tax=Pseudomassariella vexata TaxID=1141098 RepID=A0A1Y2EDI2_9PEZI|nr:uncharacterized protein BCR38DRAFT_89190 [Pseudomassariella vexata]ORY69620.1 hypothetical protein BCR38DRAFT_89190 [Pseudomassariella vexata]